MNRYKIKLLKERILAVQTKLDNIEIRLARLKIRKNEKDLR
jgi:hypothetical protein